jgi:hypothetical protein
MCLKFGSDPRTDFLGHARRGNGARNADATVGRTTGVATRFLTVLRSLVATSARPADGDSTT